jgi:hypothetical protein
MSVSRHRLARPMMALRGADLVTHVGEEARLGVGGLLGQLFGFPQGFHRLAVKGEVFQGPDAVGDLPVALDEAAHGNADPQ